MDIRIRPCRPDECDKILSLWRDAGSTPSVTDSTDALRQVLEADGGLLLVAQFQDEIVGTVIGGWDGWRGNIYRLAVLPAYRRRGIGRQLINEIEIKLTEKGAGKISVLAEKDEEKAALFWQAMKNDGYQPDERFIRYTRLV